MVGVSAPAHTDLRMEFDKIPLVPTLQLLRCPVEMFWKDTAGQKCSLSPLGDHPRMSYWSCRYEHKPVPDPLARVTASGRSSVGTKTGQWESLQDVYALFCQAWGKITFVTTQKEPPQESLQTGKQSLERGSKRAESWSYRSLLGDPALGRVWPGGSQRSDLGGAYIVLSWNWANMSLWWATPSV